MNIEQLKYIVEVAKMESFSEAAENLYITQSALSQSIARLESKLNIEIFNRTRTGVIPTEVGKNIIRKASEALIKINNITEIASGNLIHGKLRIGTIPGSSLFFPKLLANYKQLYPNVQVDLIEKSSQEIIDDIKQNKIDVGLVGLTREGTELKDPSIKSEIIYRGEMIVAVSSDSVLANKASITPEEVKQYPLVLYNDDRLWEFIHYFSKKFGDVNILYTTNNLDTVRNTVLEDLAITIGPDYTVKSDFHVLNKTIIPLKINGFNLDYPGMALTYSSSNNRSTYINDFLKKIRSYLPLLQK